MSDKKQIVKLNFADHQQSPTLDFGLGEYRRKFDAKEQPFECDEEEAAMLLRDGSFVVAGEKGKASKAARKTGGDESTTEGSV